MVAAEEAVEAVEAEEGEEGEAAAVMLAALIQKAFAVEHLRRRRHMLQQARAPSRCRPF